MTLLQLLSLTIVMAMMLMTMMPPLRNAQRTNCAQEIESVGNTVCQPLP
jgi:hypothetical protein